MSKMPKFMCHIGIEYDGGSGGGWTSDVTSSGIQAKILDICGDKIVNGKVIKQITLQVEIEKRSFKVWAMGTDGLDAVKERALRLMAGLEEAHASAHGEKSPRQGRVLEL